MIPDQCARCGRPLGRHMRVSQGLRDDALLFGSHFGYFGFCPAFVVRARGHRRGQTVSTDPNGPYAIEPSQRP